MMSPLEAAGGSTSDELMRAAPSASLPEGLTSVRSWHQEIWMTPKFGDDWERRAETPDQENATPLSANSSAARSLHDVLLTPERPSRQSVLPTGPLRPHNSGVAP